MHTTLKIENIYKEKLEVAIEFDVGSSINGSNEMIGCESTSLSHDRYIEDKAPRFCHVKRKHPLTMFVRS